MSSKPIAHVPGVPYSSHNLSHTNRFTTKPGVLKPVLVDELVPGGRYRLDIGMLADTFPTENPLFGTFEVHTDVFLCPIKNWYSTLHTNFPGATGSPEEGLFHYIPLSTANQPEMVVTASTGPTTRYTITAQQTYPALPDSLFDYLGFAVGAFPNAVRVEGSSSSAFPASSIFPDDVYYFDTSGGDYSRNLCGHGLLAYWDIYRSYYINPQEPNFLMYKNVAYFDVPYSGAFGADPAGSWPIHFATRAGFLNFMSGFGVKNPSWDGFVKLSEVPVSNLLELLNTIFTGREETEGGWVPQNLLGLCANSAYLGTRSFGLPGVGMFVRTYRPDMLTSWISQEGIEKVRKSSTLKASATGEITFEQILTGQKVFDYTTHTMISGGRYKDWVRAIYRVTPNMDSDQPVLLSHTRTRMDFQGIYQNSSTETGVSPSDQRSVLGGSVSVGQAQSVNDSIVFDCTQPSVLVVMNSVVPIADYSQGFDPMLAHTDFKHCYAADFDGIGWQPLTVATLASQPQFSRSVLGTRNNPWIQNDPFTEAVGFQPSWEEYRSRVNRVHGDFHDVMSTYVLKRVFPRMFRNPAESSLGYLYSSYIIPEMYTTAWAVTNDNPFRIQYAFGYRARLPMSKYSLPKLA